MVYASQGRYGDAANTMEEALTIRGGLEQGQTPQWRTAVALLRKAPAKIVWRNPPRLGRVGFAYLYAGYPEQSLQIFEDEVKTGLAGAQGGNLGWLWQSAYAPARRTERFKDLMRKTGFVDYWRQRGWPEFCRPNGADDFQCQ